MSEHTAFIPADLDDCGLTAPQFRVYCRILRRGACFESVASMARGCRLQGKTVKRVLKELVAIKALSKRFRLGQTSILTATPVSEWRKPRVRKGLGSNGPQVSNGLTTQPKRDPRDLGHLGPHKGSPTKVIPGKVSDDAAIAEKLKAFKAVKEAVYNAIP